MYFYLQTVGQFHSFDITKVEVIVVMKFPNSLVIRHSLSRLAHDYRYWCQEQKTRPLQVALLYASECNVDARTCAGKQGS